LNLLRFQAERAQGVAASLCDWFRQHDGNPPNHLQANINELSKLDSDIEDAAKDILGLKEIPQGVWSQFWSHHAFFGRSRHKTDLEYWQAAVQHAKRSLEFINHLEQESTKSLSSTGNIARPTEPTPRTSRTSPTDVQGGTNLPVDSNISAQPVQVFISYRHADHRELDEIRDHLGWLENSNQIKVFDDRNILAGDDWDTRIKIELEQADIIILIVTAKFMRSPYCTKVELRNALERHADEGTRIIPIIAESCDWEAMPIFKIASLPKDRANNLKPLNKWRGDKDVALTQIAQQVRKNLEQITPKQQDSQGISFVLQRMNFVPIRPGTFLMGSENGDPHERPVHEECIEKPFCIGSYVVTQGEWKVIMGTEPWKGKEFAKYDDSCPATYVSWENTQTFIAKLKSHDPENYYRLPREAEWEYAARAGTSTKFSFGDDEDALSAYGWYKGNAYDAGCRHPQRVGQRRPNGWGLYDVHGNVWEWVDDWYYGSYSEKTRPDAEEKVLRGGGYDFPANGARSAFRNKFSPVRSSHVMGFRLVRVPLG
jgi:formylglycine-generating enzyme required for sulfatase activity